MAIGAALGFAGAATQLAGGLFSSSASGHAARRARKIGDKNSEDFIRRAADAAAQAEEEQRRMHWQAARLVGRQEAAIGAAGLNADFGSAALIRSETETLIALDAATISLNADREIDDLLHGAEIAQLGGQAQGRALASQGLGELISGAAGAVGTLSNAFGRSS